MKNGILVGIDAGTSVLKSVAFTTDGEQLAVAAVPNDYTSFPDGGAEQDMSRTCTSRSSCCNIAVVSATTHSR